MRKFILSVLGLLVLAVVVLAIVIYLQPADFRISRSLTMEAAPEAVYGQVNDFHKWGAWSPWEKLDPEMERTFEGESAGKGAIYSWKSKKENVGEGRMTITESKPGDLILINLEFIKPFESTCPTEFTFKPEGKQTAVTWTMTGKKNFMHKAVHLFMGMEKMVGGEFEKGLANLKAIVEAPAKN